MQTIKKHELEKKCIYCNRQMVRTTLNHGHIVLDYESCLNKRCENFENAIHILKSKLRNSFLIQNFTMV